MICVIKEGCPHEYQADLFQIIGNEKLGTNGEDSSLTPTLRSLEGILKGKPISKAEQTLYSLEKN